MVLKWAVGLCRSAGRQLLDATASEKLETGVKALLEGIDDVRVVDIHSWEIGPGRRACIVSLVTAAPREAGYYRQRSPGQLLPGPPEHRGQQPPHRATSQCP